MSDPSAAAADSPDVRARPWLFALLALGLVAYGALQLKHLSYPLVWQDEGETVMFGQRVLEYGYPKVHDGRNVVYGMGVPLALGVKQDDDAYIGSLWGQYYFAALGVWLARSADDIHEKTALLRLPFALVGGLGLALFFLAVAPAFSSRRNVVLGAAVGFTLLVCLSTSLILHLREVRYYALAVALLATVVFLHLRRFELAGSSLRAQALLQASALFLLFNVFYPACVAAGIWLALEATIRAVKTPGSVGERLRVAAPIVSPVALTALLTLPVVIYFEIPSLSRFFSARYDFGLASYLTNLRFVLHYLLRYEFLALVLLVKLALRVTRGSEHGPVPPAARVDRRRISSALGRLCIVYVIVGARNPIFFERYFVPLSPLLSLILVLDFVSLMRGAAEGVPAARRGRLALVAASLVLLAMLGMVWLKRDELAGQIVEVSRPYQGPLDFVVPHLRAKHAEPSSLRIATNYEAEAYMYYLGSRVVGRFHAESREATLRERALQVDVVIPRKAQPKTLGLLRSYLAQGEFERHDFPVADLPYNNIPEIYAGRVLQTTHLYRTQRPGDGLQALSIYERVGRTVDR